MPDKISLESGVFKCATCEKSCIASFVYENKIYHVQMTYSPLLVFATCEMKCIDVKIYQRESGYTHSCQAHITDTTDYISLPIEFHDCSFTNSNC